MFMVGHEVKVDGLTSAAGSKLNGWQAEVTAGPLDSGRFAVKFQNGSTKKLKPENLILTSGFVAVHDSASYEDFKQGACVIQFVKEHDGGCREAKHEADKISTQFGKITFAKVDIDEMLNLKSQESVEAENLPVFVFYLSGERKDDWRVNGPDTEMLRANCELLTEQAASFIERGSSVYIHGLTSSAGKKLNDEQGVVVAGPSAAGRYHIKLEGQANYKALKPDNLKIISGPQPEEEETSDLKPEAQEAEN